jgi:hypothetical protein
LKRVSLIPPALVDPTTKALRGSEVGLVHEVVGLSDLATLAVNFDLAPAVFKDGVRRKSNLMSADWLIYDFDDGTPSARLHEILSGENFRRWRLNHLLAGSKNHLRDKGDGRGPIERFHVFIPLRTPITEADFYSFVWVEFARLFLRGLTPDPACKDVSRYLARHSAVPFTDEAGMDLPLEMFCRLNTVRQSVPKRRIQCQMQGNAIDQFRRTYAFGLLKNEMSADGQRYGTSARIVGVMLKCGLTVDEGLALFDGHAIYGDSFNRGSVERMFRQFGRG